MKSIEFERDVYCVRIAIERDREDTPAEIQYSDIYPREIEQNKFDAKIAAL